jgi:3',5'-cyclic AMP phosphodiesterase CpdA
MLIAQISDLHIRPEGQLAYRTVDTALGLRRTVAWLNGLEPQPDVVVATGDLVDTGSLEEYARLRELLRPLRAPMFLIPGNHDRRENLRAAFPEHSYLPRDGEFLQYVIEDYPIRLVGLDTMIPGKETGQMCPARLQWLETKLREQPARPTLLFMHHPPFKTGIGRMDELGMESGGGAMAEIVVGHPQVERVLCGHVHRPVQLRWAGTVASIAPSTAYQFSLNLTAGAKLAFTMEPPGVPLLLWRPDTGLIGHMGYPDAYPGPFPTRDASGARL